MATIIKFLLCLGLLFSFTGCSEPVIEDDYDAEQSTYRRMELNGKKYKYNTHLVNFLIVGTDTSDDSMGQSDFIGLLIFDRQNEEISFLTLSRNAYVPIKTYDAAGKFIDWSSNFLALSFSYGSDVKSGTYLTADAVSKLLNDIPMSYVAQLNLNGIVQIHDVVDTLEVVIPDGSLEYVDSSWSEGKTVLLTNENVEQFVRFRDISEDFTNVNRMARQKTYLLAYVDQVKELLNADFSSTAAELEDVLGSSFTNFDLSEVEAFAQMLMTYKWDEGSFYELPGTEEKGTFHDRFVVDKEALKALICDLFYLEK